MSQPPRVPPAEHESDCNPVLPTWIVVATDLGPIFREHGGQDGRRGGRVGVAYTHAHAHVAHTHIKIAHTTSHTVRARIHSIQIIRIIHAHAHAARP